MFAFSLKMLFGIESFYTPAGAFCLKSLPAIHNIKVTSSNDLHQPAVVALRLKRILSLPLQFSLLPSIHSVGCAQVSSARISDPIFYTYSFTQFARTEGVEGVREGRKSIKIS